MENFINVMIQAIPTYVTNLSYHDLKIKGIIFKYKNKKYQYL